MPPLTDKEMKLYNSQNSCYICKKKFHDVDHSDDYGDDEKFETRKFHGDNVELDIGIENCDDSDDDSDDAFDARKFYGDVVETDVDVESMIIVIMIYLLPESFRATLWSLILMLMMTMMMMMRRRRNSMVGDFMVLAKIMKESNIAITQTNTEGLHTVSVI